MVNWKKVGKKKKYTNYVKYRYFLTNSNESIWLIDSNFVGVMRFYKDKEHSDKSIAYMFIKEEITIGNSWGKSSINENYKTIVI